jgi:PIN domain nuclease of toxin-antitoxin system
VVSAISFWEIGMLIQKGRFELPEGLPAWRREVLDRGLVEIEVDGEIGMTAGLLTYERGDPADRLILATAICSGATLLTADRLILGWDGPFTSQDARV